MAEAEKVEIEEKNHGEFNTLQIVILILSVYVLIVFAIQTLIPLSPDTTQILDEIDLIVCIFFLWDFFLRLWKAPSKFEFMKWGWIDFISSIPILILLGLIPRSLLRLQLVAAAVPIGGQSPSEKAPLLGTAAATSEMPRSLLRGSLLKIATPGCAEGLTRV